MNVSVKIDTSGLARGIFAASKYSTRTMPQLVNTAAYWVAINAKNSMPFVQPGVIDAQLAVIESPEIGKRGKPLKRRKVFSAGISPLQDRKDVAMAVLIVSARANPASRYNLLTNQLYALGKNPFKGVSRAAGAAAMRALVDKMIKSRHRSPKFLLTGWIPAIRIMARFAVQKFMRGGASPSDGARQYYGADLGTAQVAGEGWACAAAIENDVGMEGKNAANFNSALMKYGAGPLQAAVDQEGERQLAYAMRKYEEELAKVTNGHWG